MSDRYEIGNIVEHGSKGRVLVTGVFNPDGRLPVRERCGNHCLLTVPPEVRRERRERERNDNLPIEHSTETRPAKADRIVHLWRDRIGAAIDRLIRRGPCANRENPVRVLAALHEVSR